MTCFSWGPLWGDKADRCASLGVRSWGGEGEADVRGHASVARMQIAGGARPTWYGMGPGGTVLYCMIDTHGASDRAAASCALQRVAIQHISSLCSTRA